MSDYILRSMNGKYAYPVHITRDKRQWESNKCWFVHCNNEIMFVHLTNRGNATHGYCTWCYHQAIMNDIFWGGKGYTNGKWVSCDKHYKTKKVFLKEDKSSKIMYESFKRRFQARKTKEAERQS